MCQLKEYTNPRINKAADYLYSQVFLVTKCKQIATDVGNHELSETFTQIETLARMAVDELRLLEEELFPPAQPDNNRSISDTEKPHLLEA